jgi:hypothetical protein
MTTLVDAVEKFGFPVALVIYFAWQQSKDKKSQEKQRLNQEEKLTSLEVFCREELLSTTKEVSATNKICTSVMEDAKEALVKNIEIVTKNTVVLDKCLSKLETE